MITYHIILKDVEISAKLGVFDWEQAKARNFHLQVECEVLADDSVREDNLQATLNYAEIESLLREISDRKIWQLIENLLDTIANEMLESFDKLQSLVLTLDKPQALEHTACTSVRLQRRREQQ